MHTSLNADDIQALFDFRDGEYKGQVPLIEGWEKTEAGDAIRRMERLGFVRVTKAIVGPLTQPTGEVFLTVTEAGRIALEAVTAMPEGEFWIVWSTIINKVIGVRRGTFAECVDERRRILARIDEETFNHFWNDCDKMSREKEEAITRIYERAEKFRVEGFRTYPEWTRLAENGDIPFTDILIGDEFTLDDGRRYFKNGDTTAVILDNGDEKCIPAEAKVMNVRFRETDVHTEHCCANCGCKYGEEESGKCSVCSGRKMQSYPCGQLEVCGAR